MVHHPEPKPFAITVRHRLKAGICNLGQYHYLWICITKICGCALDALTAGGKEHRSGARTESVHPFVNGVPQPPGSPVGTHFTPLFRRSDLIAGNGNDRSFKISTIASIAELNSTKRRS